MVDGLSTFNNIVSRLEAKKSGDGWVARCPAHDDNWPSLSISQGDNGTILLKCHAGCPTQQIVEALGLKLSNLFPTTPSQDLNKRATKSRVYVTAQDALTQLERSLGKRSFYWTYTDDQGVPVGVVVRWDNAAGKDIRPISKSPDGWTIGAMPAPRPLYKLPELRSADTLFVCEGEKCCDSLATLGLTSTTSAGGSQATAKTDWSPVKGKHVVILPDHDKAGEKFAADAARLCNEAGATSIRIIRLAEFTKDLPEGGDVADVLSDLGLCGIRPRSGATPQDFGEWLRAVVESTPTWQTDDRRAESNHESSNVEAEKQRKPPSVVEVLVSIGKAYELWHDPDGVGYATVSRRAHKIRGKSFRQTLTSEYYKLTQKPANGEAVQNAINTLEAIAVNDGEEHQVYVRVGGCRGKIYLHLADAESTVVEIDNEGWRVCDNPPVRFRKPSGALALPMPERGGCLGELRAFANMVDDQSFALLVAWLVGSLRADGPYPLLLLTGEQGSAKSTTAKVVKALIDPSSATLRSGPKETRDLMIQAQNNWALCFDNISVLPAWLSDDLCRLATGGGFSTRELYSNDDETLFDYKRPTILNGIEDFATRPDLLERAIVLRLPAIPENKRRPESEFWTRFNAVKPRILGAILERVSAGLRELPKVQTERLPRMADFALFALACEQGAGETPTFWDAYHGNQVDGYVNALEDSPVASAIVGFMAHRTEWTGTPSELLKALTEFTTDTQAKDWPKKANSLTNKLRRIAPNLRRVHQIDWTEDRTRSKRLVQITRHPRHENEGNTSSSASPSSPTRENKKFLDDAVTSGDDPATIGDDLTSSKSVEKTSQMTMGDDGDDDFPLFSGANQNEREEGDEWTC